MPLVCFDGIVGPTHSYAGLSAGNLAATKHAGELGNPKAAALEGLAKMRFVHGLGVRQAVLPPHPRPDLGTLRQLGFSGSDADVLTSAARCDDGLLLRQVSSASAMWAANAATVAPSADTGDGKLHVSPANLSAMFHRSLEPAVTTRILRAIFADASRFVVHDALPAGEHFADEGAANHLRLFTSRGALHAFAWGRSAVRAHAKTLLHPARQTLEASLALARRHALPPERCLFPQQSPAGIDAGAFHTDVLATGLGNFLMLHERAFVGTERLMDELRAVLGSELVVCLARQRELPVEDAVDAYPFNSELVPLPSGQLALVAPRESENVPRVRRFLDRVLAEPNPVAELRFVDVNASMKNGGGPACLRLAVPLEEAELAALGARVIFDEGLATELEAWVARHYRDRLDPEDFSDPALLDEVRRALDELCKILALGSVYDFQRAG